MTVNQDTVSINEAIHMIPESNFDVTFINMLSSLATRMGDMNFVTSLQDQSNSPLQKSKWWRLFFLARILGVKSIGHFSLKHV